MQERGEPKEIAEIQELPPFVKTWQHFYRLLVVWLLVLILVFYLFTKYFE